jgi:transposase
MARPKGIVDQELIDAAKAELKKSAGHPISLRLLAIVRSGDYSQTEIAAFCGVSRGTVWRWITRFRNGGVEGLFDRPKGHNPSKLQEKHRCQIARWLEKSKDSRGKPIHWTLAKLRQEIAGQFGIEITVMPLWSHLQKMGFRQKVPRPLHTGADPLRQEAFKKKRRN